LEIEVDAVVFSDPEMFRQLAEEEPMTWESSDDAVKFRHQTVDLVRAYAKEYRPQPEKIIAMEASLEAPFVHPTTGEDLGVPLFGVVDLVLDTTSSVLLVDFKTSATATLIEQSCSVQLTLYSLLMQGNGYDQVETEIRQLVKTKTPKICAYRFGQRTEGHIRQFFDLCREYLVALDHGVFNPRPCWSCNLCDYRGLCTM